MSEQDQEDVHGSSRAKVLYWILAIYIFAVGYRYLRSLPWVRFPRLATDIVLPSGEIVSPKPLPAGFALSRSDLGDDLFVAISDDGSVMTYRNYRERRPRQHRENEFVVRRPSGKLEFYRDPYATLRADGVVIRGRRSELVVGSEVIPIKLEENHPYSRYSEFFSSGNYFALSASKHAVLVTYGFNEYAYIKSDGSTTLMRLDNQESEARESPFIAFGRNIFLFNRRSVSSFVEPPALVASGKVLKRFSVSNDLYGRNDFGYPMMMESDGGDFRGVKFSNFPDHLPAGRIALDGTIYGHWRDPSRGNKPFAYRLTPTESIPLGVPAGANQTEVIAAVDGSMSLLETDPYSASKGLYYVRYGQFFKVPDVLSKETQPTLIPNSLHDVSGHQPYVRPLARSGAFVVRVKNKLILFQPNFDLRFH